MSKLQKHRWLRAFLIWGLLQVLLYLCRYLPLPTISKIVAQGILLMAVFLFLDHRYFHIYPHFFSTKISLGRQLLVIGPLLAYMLVFNLAGAFSIQPKNITLALVVSLEAGIMEEYVCRGLLLGGLLKDSQKRLVDIWLAVIGSSLIFGLAHLQNISHQPLDYTLFQIGAAILLGTFYGAIYVRTHSLVWVMIGHFVQDFVAIGVNGLRVPKVPEHIWFVILFLALIFLSSAIWLLRPKKQQEIIAGFVR